MNINIGLHIIFIYQRLKSMICDMYNQMYLRENLPLRTNLIPRAAQILGARCSEQLNLLGCHFKFVCPHSETCLCYPSASRILRSCLDFFLNLITPANIYVHQLQSLQILHLVITHLIPLQTIYQDVI